MCFSANASFIAGTTLVAAGIISVSQVKEPKQLFFAIMPMFFGIQQLCEGVLWLSLTGNSFQGWTVPIKYIFLLFAQVIWPFYVPLSYLLIEKIPKRKKILRYFVFAGIVVSLLLAWRLIFFTSYVQINGCHIDFTVTSPEAIKIATAVLYLSAIVIAPFFSSLKFSKVLATANVVGLLVTLLFFEVWLVSVWCFFAAVQSVIIVIIMRKLKSENRTF